jgi:hypothetical protein
LTGILDNNWLFGAAIAFVVVYLVGRWLPSRNDDRGGRRG